MLTGLLRVCLLVLTLAGAQAALADERILSFDSDLTVEANGDFLVVETIRVRAEGDKISRGIFRDFPMLLRDEGGNRRVGFDLVSATRDGQPETTRIEETSRALRIWLGNPNATLPPGEHVWRLTYRTDRQLRMFDSHDEVYWNATGTEWLFPIDAATATIRLPQGARITELAAYTGSFGDTGGDALFDLTAEGVAVFRTTRALGERQGLTVAVGFEKGTVAPPSDQTRRDWFLRDHGPGLWALAGFGVVLAWYLGNWWLFGRDPRRGVVIPRWDPPAGMSAALVSATFRNRDPAADAAMSLSIVELASRGVLAFEIGGTTSRLELPEGDAPGDLLPEQQLIVQAVREAGGRFDISAANGPAVRDLQAKVWASLRKQRRALRLFRPYGLQLAVGLGLSLPALILPATRLPEPLNVLMILFAVAAGLLLFLLRGAMMARGAGKTAGVWLTLVLGILICGAGAGALLVAHLHQGGEPILPAALTGILLANAIFAPILGGPTPEGRRRLDEIEGLRDYIQVAERDRLSMPGTPDMSVAQFERILPFAMALGLEEIWVSRFRIWLASTEAPATAAGAGAHVLTPQESLLRLYRDRTPATTRQPGVMDRLSTSLTAALPVAAASSSGVSGGGSSGRSGGGSSGGGGGGGGGGGW